jgi:uncharacterized YccA/Bax inhibitor family protein
MANNPAFNRIEKDAQTGYAGFRTDAAANSQAATGSMTAQQLQDLYNQPSAVGTEPSGVRSGTDRPVTMDDVIMKTLGLFALVLVTGTVGWFVSAANETVGFALWMGGAIAGLIIGLVIAFKKTLSVPLIVTYALVEGLFIGAVSQFFEQQYEGIVAQAVLATVATFAGMFIAYKTGLIKVNDKFRRIMVMALIGYALFAVVNFVFAIVTNTPFGIGGTGALGIGISVFAVGLAALTLALNFDSIDYAIRTGAPQKYSWLLAHGMIVTLVWLYIEFLRLLGRMRS